MKKTEREIKDRAVIDLIIRRSRVCRLGLADRGYPYVLPLCFGYDGKALYFHCAEDGRKLDILRRNNKVCFEFDIFEGMIKAEQACNWGIRYQSVIGFGIAHRIDDITDRKYALSLIMAQYSKNTFSFSPEMVSRTAVIKIEIKSLTGKQSSRKQDRKNNKPVDLTGEDRR